MAASDWQEVRCPFPLLRVPVMRQFLDVVYQTVELPLRIHFLPPSQGKALELFVVPQIAEHGLHGGKATAIADATFGTVDGLFHPLGVEERRGLMLWKKATCRVGVLSGVRRHLSRWVQGTQSCFAPWNL